MTLVVLLVGAALGALNGALVAFLRVPSIVVTLATMVGLRDALRWATQGAWVQDLPASFQWLGLSQATYPVAIGGVAALLLAAIAWGARHLAAGRAVYATGSSVSAARLAGLDVARVKFWVFTLAGVLTGRVGDRQRRALQPGAEQCRARPGDEGHRVGRRRWRGDHRRARHVHRHGAGRRAARRDRSRADVSRRERLLGARHPGRDHPCGRRRGCAAHSTPAAGCPR